MNYRNLENLHDKFLHGRGKCDGQKTFMNISSSKTFTKRYHGIIYSDFHVNL